MDRTNFINLIGTKTLVDYQSGNELQRWSMETFSYDKATDIVTHNRLDLITDVFIPKAFNPRTGNKSEATHG